MGIRFRTPRDGPLKRRPSPGPIAFPVFSGPQADFLYDSALRDHLFLAIASQPIGDSAPEDWAAEQMARRGCTATEPIAVDGATGLTGVDDCEVAVVTTAGRGYMIVLLYV